MSKQRFFSSALLIAITLFGIVNKWAFLFVLLALIMGGLYEFFYLTKKKGIPIYSYTGIIIGLFIPISIFMQFELTKRLELLFVVILLLMIFMMQFMRKNNANAIVGISTTFFGVLYVSWLFSFLIKIRFLLPGWDGIGLLGFILLVTKMGDIGALLVGSSFGKHPLLPRISPNKTIEGSFGSFIFSTIAAILARSFIPAQFDFSLTQIAIIGVVIGGLGQLGDLSESLIKRDFNVKDSGNWLPGMGGVLDVIDSILFTAPAFYFYMSSFLKV